MLQTLLLANVSTRIELSDFMLRLYQRYGLVVGDREAEQALGKGSFDEKEFRANTTRLERQLGFLNLIHRLTGTRVYAINPYYQEAP